MRTPRAEHPVGAQPMLLCVWGAGGTVPSLSVTWSFFLTNNPQGMHVIVSSHAFLSCLSFISRKSAPAPTSQPMPTAAKAFFQPGPNRAETAGSTQEAGHRKRHSQTCLLPVRFEARHERPFQRDAGNCHQSLSSLDNGPARTRRRKKKCWCAIYYNMWAAGYIQSWKSFFNQQGYCNCARFNTVYHLDFFYWWSQRKIIEFQHFRGIRCHLTHPPKNPIYRDLVSPCLSLVIGSSLPTSSKLLSVFFRALRVKNKHTPFPSCFELVVKETGKSARG